MPNQPNEPILPCPHCGKPVPLTQALAEPLLASAKADFEAKLRARDHELDAQKQQLISQQQAAERAAATLRQREATLASQRSELDAEIARRTQTAVSAELERRLAAETKSIREAEERRARERMADTLASRDRDAQDQQERLNELSKKLASSQAAEAEWKRRERELGDRERELQLQVEQEVSGRIDSIRATAASEAEQKLGLQLADKDRAIRELAAKLDEASRKAQQGSQQAQGETLELLLEDQLRRHFPFDDIQPVPKGEFGGDTLQIIRDNTGRESGRILWEFKRTKIWSAGWIPKLKNDQRTAQADLAVIVSQAMPPDVQHFNEVDGVWVSSLACTLPVATAMRSSLLQLAGQRRNAEGQQTKSELIYAYLTGPQFRGRIEAISERWHEMQADLASEKKQTMIRWAKREKQLETLLVSTTGILGDIHGIAGNDVAEIDRLGSTLMLDEQSELA